MHTVVTVSDADVKDMLAADISNSIDYFSHVVGIALINGMHRHQQQPQHRHAIECGAWQGHGPEKG
jgi:hypothetical protein